MALVNDYEVVVAGLHHMLAHYSDRVQVVELVAGLNVREQVDVALYDNFADRPESTGGSSRVLDDPRVENTVVYTWNFQPTLIERELQKGARGYLSKTLAARELVEGIEQVHAGRVVISPAPTAVNPTGGNWPGREEGLSYREGEVLALITLGLSNAEIAQGMYLSPNSVKSYIRSAYRKIGVARRSQAVAWGMRHGFAPDYLREEAAAAEG